MSAILTALIGSGLLSAGGGRTAPGKTLAAAHVCGGSQSLNAITERRVLTRWMGRVTIPGLSPGPRGWDEFDPALRMRPSPACLSLVWVCEELMKFSWMTRARTSALTDRYPERIESDAPTSKRVNRSRLRCRTVAASRGPKVSRPAGVAGGATRRRRASLRTAGAACRRRAAGGCAPFRRSDPVPRHGGHRARDARKDGAS